MPQSSLPPWATWHWQADESDHEPSRCCFDEIAIGLTKRMPCLGKLSMLNATMSATVQATSRTSATTAGQLVRNCLSALDATLRGASQVVVINNPIAGILIIASLFFPSAVVGVHGVLGLVGATSAAIVLRLDAQALASGLFGYNGLLVGMALATFLSRDDGEWDAAILIASVLMGGVSTLFQLSLGNALVPTFKTPPFTLAFNLTFLLFLLASSSWPRFSMPHHHLHATNNAEVVEATADEPRPVEVDFVWVIKSALISVGQVFLCESALSGGLILIGMAISSRIAASSAFLGALGATLLALLLGVDAHAIGAGLWGYSSCLTAIATVTFFVPNLRCYIMAAVGVVITVLFDGALREAFAPVHMPIGTLPFCCAGLTLMLTQSKVPGFEAVPLSDVSTPEDHLYSARVGRIRHATDEEVAAKHGVDVAAVAQSPQQPKGSSPKPYPIGASSSTSTHVQPPPEPNNARTPGATTPGQHQDVREAIVVSRPSTRDPSTHGGNALSSPLGSPSVPRRTLHGGSQHEPQSVLDEAAGGEAQGGSGVGEKDIEVSMA